ncbi:MAG: TolC family protein [Bacteroidota bacterium]
MRKLFKHGILGICLLLSSLSVGAQERSLEYYISTAITNSPLLNDYNNQKLSNLIDSLRINASMKPQVNGISSNSYAPSFNGFGYDGAVTNGANFSQLVSVSKNFTQKNYLQNQYEAIRLLNESLTLSGKISEQDLLKSVTAQYITAYGDWQQLGFSTDMLSLLKKEELILKNLTEKGVYRQTDYLSFLVTIQQQEIQISQARLLYQNDFATLNYLSGITDTTTLSIPAPSIELSIVPDAQSTVFYEQYRMDSLRLRNSDALIDYTYKPKISAYADGGYLTAFPSDFYKNFGVSVGLNITVPIYDGKQRKMQHDKISISERTRQGYRDFFKKQFNQQLAQLGQQLKNTQQLIEQLNGQIKYTETLVEANRKLLETGDARMADYILAIGNYLNAKNAIRQNSINKLQIINQINYWNKK